MNINNTPPPPRFLVFTLNKSAVIFALFLLFSAVSHAQAVIWYEGFYIESSVQKYFAPEMLDGLVRPETGFRAGLGYEFKRFRFTVESGRTYIEGTNELVTDITVVPLLFKIGYALPIYSSFGVQADLGAGILFSHTLRYETAIDLVLENKREDNIHSPISTARLYGTWSPWDFLKIYAGGGADIIFEDDGPISLPIIEAGISFKPFALVNFLRARKNVQIILKR
jgi:hypothetical protein